MTPFSVTCSIESYGAPFWQLLSFWDINLSIVSLHKMGDKLPIQNLNKYVKLK